jgi:TusA-related sulfurtransferase
MAITVDARGLACPQPVIQTRKAMQQADQIATLVDNETAVTNVSRMAEKAGWQVNVVPLGDEYRIELNREGPAPQPQELPIGRAEVLGVKLACEGSPVLDDLCALEAAGVDILACGTCLNYFELQEKLAVGRVSNMYDIAEVMLNASKVVNL